MSNLSFFFIFGIIPVIIINSFWLKAQKKFLSLYKKDFSLKTPLSSEEIINLCLNKPGHFIKNIPYILFGRFSLFFRKYNNSELNKTAKKARDYFWIILLILILNFLFQLFYFVLWVLYLF